MSLFESIQVTAQGLWAFGGTSLLARWCDALLSFSWQAVLVVWLFYALERAFAFRRAATRYAWWLTALWVLTLCPFVNLAVGILKSAETETHFSSTTMLVGNDVATDPWILRGLGLVWLLGFTFMCLRLACAGCIVTRLRHRRFIQGTSQFDAFKQRVAPKLRVTIAWSTQVPEALAVGWFRPMILLPIAWSTQLPPQALEAVIAHELAHLKRWDLWVNLFQRIAEAILFFHPLVWWVNRQIRMERELCCDEQAVAWTGQRTAYVRTLEMVARQRLSSPEYVLGNAVRGGKKMNLLKRVENVLACGTPRPARLGPLLCLIAIPLGLVFQPIQVDAAGQGKRPVVIGYEIKPDSTTQIVDAAVHGWIYLPGSLTGADWQAIMVAQATPDNAADNAEPGTYLLNLAVPPDSSYAANQPAARTSQPTRPQQARFVDEGAWFVDEGQSAKPKQDSDRVTIGVRLEPRQLPLLYGVLAKGAASQQAPLVVLGTLFPAPEGAHAPKVVEGKPYHPPHGQQPATRVHHGVLLHQADCSQCHVGELPGMRYRILQGHRIAAPEHDRLQRIELEVRQLKREIQQLQRRAAAGDSDQSSATQRGPAPTSTAQMAVDFLPASISSSGDPDVNGFWRIGWVSEAPPQASHNQEPLDPRTRPLSPRPQ